MENIDRAQDTEEYLLTMEGSEELIADEKIISFKKDMRNYKNYLIRQDLAPQTIYIYTKVVNDYFKEYRVLTKLSLLKWKQKLIERYAPNGVNQRINAMNKYLTYINRKGLKLSGVAIQRSNFANNIVTYEDYKYFLRMLKKDGDMLTYYIVKFISCTGARVSELIKFKVEDVKAGYMDIIGKGRKYRRIYIPNKLQKEALEWLEKKVSIMVRYLHIKTLR